MFTAETIITLPDYAYSPFTEKTNYAKNGVNFLIVFLSQNSNAELLEFCYQKPWTNFFTVLFSELNFWKAFVNKILRQTIT